MYYCIQVWLVDGPSNILFDAPSTDLELCKAHQLLSQVQQKPLPPDIAQLNRFHLEELSLSPYDLLFQRVKILYNNFLPSDRYTIVTDQYHYLQVCKLVTYMKPEADFGLKAAALIHDIERWFSFAGSLRKNKCIFSQMNNNYHNAASVLVFGRL